MIVDMKSKNNVKTTEINLKLFIKDLNYSKLIKNRQKITHSVTRILNRSRRS